MWTIPILFSRMELWLRISSHMVSICALTAVLTPAIMAITLGRAAVIHINTTIALRGDPEMNLRSREPDSEGCEYNFAKEEGPSPDSGGCYAMRPERKETREYLETSQGENKTHAGQHGDEVQERLCKISWIEYIYKSYVSIITLRRSMLPAAQSV